MRMVPSSPYETGSQAETALRGLMEDLRVNLPAEVLD